jgi:hypothetical protein
MTRLGVRALTAIGLMGAAVCAPIAITLARPRAPAVVEAPPPPLPPAGPVALPARSLADAAAFQAYLERVGGASAAFTSGAAVGQTLRDSAAFSTRALVRDAVAYGAIAALQDQQFVNELRAAGNSPDNRRLMAGYLMADPGYAFLFRGSSHAAGLARVALENGGLRLYNAGKAVRQASYDMQHQPWSKLEVEGRPARLAAVEAEGRGSLPDAADHMEALRSAETGAAPMSISAGSLAPPYTPLVAKAVQLAAIAALGEGSDELYDRIASLAAEETTDNCLHIAKLNLYQCLAVAKPNYEDAFCAGQHAMVDTGACLVRGAGGLTPFELGPPPPAPVFKRVVVSRRPAAHGAHRAKKK